MLEQDQQQMQAVHEDTSVSQQDKWGKMKQIRQSTDEQIKAVLNPEQQQEFAKMTERRGPPAGGMGQGGTLPQQAPPQ